MAVGVTTRPFLQLCLALGLKPSATAAAVFYAVTTHIEDLGHERLHPLFLLRGRSRGREYWRARPPAIDLAERLLAVNSWAPA
jgi:hypothetical protein